MNLANLSLADLAGTLISFFLTLMVFSYALGDNVLFRLTVHIFVGVAAGYAAVVAWYNVIWGQMFLPLLDGGPAQLLYISLPLFLGFLLLFKASSRLTILGNPATAFLVGVGMAAAVGGSVFGTIFPQIGATINLFDLEAIKQMGVSLWSRLGQGSLILIGTMASLIYFHFGARSRAGQAPQRQSWIENLAWVGEVFIAITLGVVFAGVYSSALTALVERLYFVGDVLIPLVLIP